MYTVHLLLNYWTLVSVYGDTSWSCSVCRVFHPADTRNILFTLLSSFVWKQKTPHTHVGGAREHTQLQEGQVKFMPTHT